MNNCNDIEIKLDDKVNVRMMETEDATATAEDIRTGKIAYTATGKTVGTYAGIIPTGKIELRNLDPIDVTPYAVAQVVAADLKPENIRKGINVLGVEGNLIEGINPEGKINITSTALIDVTNYKYAQVYDPDLIPENIVKGKNILGVEGLAQEGIIPSGKKIITDTLVNDVSAYKEAQVVDINLIASNIRKGVNVLGVEGSVQEGITPSGNLEIKKVGVVNVREYATAQVVDNELLPENIIEGKSILGIVGNAVKPQNKVEIKDTNIVDVKRFAEAQVVDANLIPENIKKGTSILGIEGLLTSGIDTSDATAVEKDIRINKTAYIATGKVIGTILDYDGSFHKNIDYTPVKYLSANGNQYIDTGVIFNDKLSINIKYRYPIAPSNGGDGFFGTFSRDNTDGRFQFLAFGTRSSLGIGTNEIVRDVPIEVDGKFHETFIDNVNKKIYYDDTMVYENFDSSANATNKLTGYLFWVNQNGSKANYEISNCQLSLDTVLVRDYIPVLDKNGRPAMYDLVNNSFKYNSGTGEFGYETLDGIIVQPKG